MFRAAILLFSGNSLSSLFSLARSVVIAHLISVSDFGIASTFALAMSVIEMMTALGLQQQIVQHKDGDDSSF
jgi:O-antigen/teichoic acid export membrane protein